MTETVINLKAPYVIYLGDEATETYGKTGAGLVQWRPDLCIGQIREATGAIDLGIPDMTVEDAVAAGAGSVIMGAALIGGGIPETWLKTLVRAAEAGIDIVAGTHLRLADTPALCAATEKSGARLVDVRVPPSDLPVGNGKKRTGRRLLTVGTDCALGKKYTALALERDMRAAGLNVDFRATGQTGIMIAGRGIPIDAVVSDFIAGAAEVLSPDNDPDHWDVIEGQGGLFHPAYGAVTHGLLVGSQPDAFVVCHEAGRTHISGWEHFELPTIEEVIDRTIEIGALTNPEIHCVGISVNTSSLKGAARENYLAELAQKYNLPCVDPLIDGTAPIVKKL